MDGDCVWDARAILGEGPVWLPHEQCLYWLDVKAPAVYRYVPETADKKRWPMPERIGFLLPRRGGGFLAGFKSGVANVDLDSGKIEPLGGPEYDLPGNRLNDGKVDFAGRAWFGSMDDDEVSETGKLYSMDSDGEITMVDDGYVVTNGPAISPDGGTLYHTDTFRRTIYAFDLRPNGALENKRVFVETAPDAGYPDGMTVDAEGFLWVAHFGGWRLTRFRPDGSIERTLPMPVAQVTSCAFGGSDLDRLYVTTAAIGLDDKALRAQPLAGGLFELAPDVGGLPSPHFNG
jgi:sugar lactone lactonase YvrE